MLGLEFSEPPGEDRLDPYGCRPENGHVGMEGVIVETLGTEKIFILALAVSRMVWILRPFRLFDF